MADAIGRSCPLCGEPITKKWGRICPTCLSERITWLVASQKWSLAKKVEYSVEVLRRVMTEGHLPVAVCVSGGKASTVLVHLAKKHLPANQVTYWFGDTRVEYPETYDFLRELDWNWALDLKWIKTPHNPFRVFAEKGIPVGGKRRDNWPKGVRDKLNIGSECCRLLKHGPIDSAIKKAGITKVLLGIQASESTQRKFGWADYGEIFTTKKGKTRIWPLSIWRDEDIWAYHEKHDIPFCKVYSMGYKRNGCWPCCMDVLFKDGALWTLEEQHPRHFNTLMKKGFGEVINEFKRLKMAESTRSRWKKVRELPDRRGCFRSDE